MTSTSTRCARCRAVITHAHADHARRGHGAYLATQASQGVLRQRLGAISLQGLAYGEAVTMGGARVSLHPAGHVLGSAQVRVEVDGAVWVVSGDYYASGAEGLGAPVNPTCAPFEPLRCDCFVTESTFALPLYRWPPQREVFAEIGAWWRATGARRVIVTHGSAPVLVRWLQQQGLEAGGFAEPIPAWPG